ncbi:MAG: CinA family protein [Rhodospirillales bacterium]|jgi:nicotinamide-nucleotide amidase|nr:CinA family protein [Rhodospirillales bacterium]
MYPAEQLQLAEEVLKACRSRGLHIATAESCTGGLIAGCLTAISGSSDVVERGFVTYTNQAKAEMLGIAPELIERFGAVSNEVACAMAEGALAKSSADLAVAVTGIAGPTGGTDEKPVGLVHFAVAAKGGRTIDKHHVFDGDRTAVRAQTLTKALKLLKIEAEEPS